jgi:hypothetical protein
MAKFLDVCRFTPTAGGTTDWTYSSAVQGYQSPAAANAVNGAIYRYRAESADLSQWEVGFGAYNSGTGVFARATVLFNSSGSTGKVNFSSAPQVAIVALAEDISVLVGAIRVQKFTTSGTYTPDPNLLYCIIECLGAGGGGGGCANNPSGQFGGGGGGAGSYSRLVASAATIGASKAVTVGVAGSAGLATTPWTGGAGGDTSVGTLCIGKGGSGGNSNGAGQLGQGGAGGVAGTGDITATGQPGGSGISSSITTISVPGAFGGSSLFGGGGAQTVGSSSHTGDAGSGFGSGGAGGVSFNNGGGGPGGAGAPGLVIITEYCSQ